MNYISFIFIQLYKWDNNLKNRKNRVEEGKDRCQEWGQGSSWFCYIDSCKEYSTKYPDHRVSITEIGDSNFDNLTKGIFYVASWGRWGCRYGMVSGKIGKRRFDTDGIVLLVLKKTVCIKLNYK